MALTCSFQAKATGSTKQLVITFWLSPASFFSQVSKKLRPELSQVAGKLRLELSRVAGKLRLELIRVAGKLRPELSRARVAPKRLLRAISDKTIGLRHKKRGTDQNEEIRMDGQDGLWQRSILMGEKCEPLNFSGVIYYDSNGKQLEEAPVRSPRASPLHRYL